MRGLKNPDNDVALSGVGRTGNAKNEWLVGRRVCRGGDVGMLFCNPRGV